jgi:hypothetical protein
MARDGNSLILVKPDLQIGFLSRESYPGLVQSQFFPMVGPEHFGIKMIN